MCYERARFLLAMTNMDIPVSDLSGGSNSLTDPFVSPTNSVMTNLTFLKKEGGGGFV